MITFDLPNEDAVRHALNLSALRLFLARAQKALPLTGEISVLFTSDREIRRLNRTFRRKDKTTDVLSFPAPEFPESSAGDLAISLDAAARQAKQHGHALEFELKILLLHGILHLAGYDHETDSGEMAAREDQLRRRFRLPATLIARNTSNRGGRR
jgi:probable rRNA maturation factor